MIKLKNPSCLPLTHLELLENCAPGVNACQLVAFGLLSVSSVAEFVKLCTSYVTF